MQFFCSCLVLLLASEQVLGQNDLNSVNGGTPVNSNPVNIMDPFQTYTTNTNPNIITASDPNNMIPVNLNANLMPSDPNTQFTTNYQDPNLNTNTNFDPNLNTQGSTQNFDPNMMPVNPISNTMTNQVPTSTNQNTMTTNTNTNPTRGDQGTTQYIQNPGSILNNYAPQNQAYNNLPPNHQPPQDMFAMLFRNPLIWMMLDLW